MLVSYGAVTRYLKVSCCCADTLNEAAIVVNNAIDKTTLKALNLRMCQMRYMVYEVIYARCWKRSIRGRYVVLSRKS